MDTITARGHGGATVTFDGAFVTITREGFLARATVGKGEKRIPIASITAVQWKPPGALVNGFIQFTLAGGVERRSGFGSQTSSAANDENSVIVTKKQGPEFEVLRAAIDAALAARHAPAPAAAVAPAGGDDIATQISKLATLRDQGILTEDEFSAKKVELLGRL